MLEVAVELLHGIIRAASPDGNALADGEHQGEWPPSPARLFSALVAADGSGSRCSVTSGSELCWLEAQAPPLIFASESGEVEVSELAMRYVVLDKRNEGSTQDYPLRTTFPHRPGVRQSPRESTVRYVWLDSDPPETVLHALRLRAARIGYLGCSDSPVRVCVDTVVQRPDGQAWIPDRDASFSLPVPFPGFLEALDEAFERWSAGGRSERFWIRTARSGYRAPGYPADSGEKSIVVWLRFDRAVRGKHLVTLTTTLRAAVLARYQELLGLDETVPSFLHGHREPGEGTEQVCFLGLPHVGQSYADGRLFGAAVVIPPAVSRKETGMIFAALARMSTLTKRAWFDIPISFYGGQPKPWAANPSRWQSPAKRWVSATPVVYERWGKGYPDLEEVARWCDHAGLPEPIAFGFKRTPLISGALDLHPAEVFRPDKERRPYSHMWIEFAQKVAGPVVVGRGRYLGLGLMVPADRGGTGDE